MNARQSFCVFGKVGLSGMVSATSHSIYLIHPGQSSIYNKILSSMCQHVEGEYMRVG